LHPQSNILGLAVLIIVGYAGAKLLRNIHFPAVTSYLLIGILIGPHVCNIIPHIVLGLSGIISHFVLGIIAFSLGESFRIKELRSSGSSVIWISIMEAACAWLIVTGVMIGYQVVSGLPVHPAFIMGAAASATAPAATVMVIREYRAHGPVTNMLLRVVAIDDAWCLILSAIAITFASAISTGSIRVITMLHAMIDLLLSFFLGAVAGIGLGYLSKLIRNREEYAEKGGPGPAVGPSQGHPAPVPPDVLEVLCDLPARGGQEGKEGYHQSNFEVMGHQPPCNET